MSFSLRFLMGREKGRHVSRVSYHFSFCIVCNFVYFEKQTSVCHEWIKLYYVDIYKVVMNLCHDVMLQYVLSFTCTWTPCVLQVDAHKYMVKCEELQDELAQVENKF